MGARWSARTTINDLERSNIALSIVREIRNNTVQRRRSGRTLEALSVALGWHPRHLAAVLLGLAYVVVLMMVILERPRPRRQGRHRRDQLAGDYR